MWSWLFLTKFNQIQPRLFLQIGRKLYYFLAIWLWNMVLYWRNAGVNQLTFICLLAYLWSNMLKRYVNILYSLKSDFFHYFLVFEVQKSIGFSKHSKTYIFFKAGILSYHLKPFHGYHHKTLEKTNFSGFYPLHLEVCHKCYYRYTEHFYSSFNT